MKFRDFVGQTQFDSSIVGKLQLVLSRSKEIHLDHHNDFGISHIQKSSLLLDQINLDFKYVEQSKAALFNSSLINVVFHCPFIKNELPGTFYMPVLTQNKVDRSAFICTLTDLHKHLNANLDPKTILITTPEWYFTHLDTFNTRTSSIIPVFLNQTIDFPMYFRHASYVALIKKLRRIFANAYQPIISFHDSDLLPIAAWNPIVDIMLETSFDILFTYRYSPNLLPLNGGLFFINLTSKAEQLFNYSLGLYDELANDHILSKLYPSSIKIWDGDQLVINTIYKWDNEDPFQQYSGINSAKLGILPASVMNYSVKTSFTSTLLHQYVVQRCIVP